MSRPRQIIAITLVAAALCADQALAATPALRPQVGSAAGKLVNHLSVRFRRVVPKVRVYETRRDVDLQAPLPLLPENVTPELHPRTSLSPFQFRLPPPAL